MSAYLLMSDIHFHDFTAFSGVNEEGVNSRLQITIDEVKRACKFHLDNGGDKKLLIAGDVFHTRGAVKSSVLNPVRDLFHHLCHDKGWKIYILAGNHDLESKNSNRLTSSVTALEEFCQEVVHESMLIEDFFPSIDVYMVPWHQNIDDLKNEIESISPSERADCDLIIHAPVDGVITGLPSHGLTAEYLERLGYRKVFSGHYHNHKNFNNKVYSIGALTHQTFSDIGSRAGFLIVEEDGSVSFQASHTPKFVEVTYENFDEAALIVDGNYVRCKVGSSKDSEVLELREHFEKLGAKGIVISRIKEDVESRDDSSPASHTSLDSLEKSVSNYISSKGLSKEVEKLCLEILDKAKEISE